MKDLQVNGCKCGEIHVIAAHHLKPDGYRSGLTDLLLRIHKSNNPDSSEEPLIASMNYLNVKNKKSKSNRFRKNKI